MSDSYIPFTDIPMEVHDAANTLFMFFERAGMQRWQFSYVADRRLVVHMERQLEDLTRVNDALAAKVAEWKARAEKAEAALKAAEDDRHLTTPCA